MIIGGHSIIYSTNPDADRAFLRDVMKLTHVDVGGGWLIFGLPPAEIAVHPSGENDVHEFYLMCDDIDALLKEMTQRGIKCGAAEDQGWGILSHVVLPGGGKLGVYQPQHARPKPMPSAESARSSSSRPSRKTAKPGRRKSASKQRRKR